MHSSRTTPSYRSTRPQVMSLMYSLPVRRLKEILGRLLPDLTLGPVEMLPSVQLARLYLLSMSDGSKLLLSYAPSLTIRLMRHETTILSSEAALIQLITERNRQEPESSLAGQKQPSSAPTKILGLVPTLIKHSTNNRELDHPYSIFEAPTGAPLSTLASDLSLSERRTIDKQIGSAARALATITSPSGTFGTVNRVLPARLAPGSTIPREQEDVKTWSEAFNLLLEGVLRDGEDMAVLIPYETIRAHYKRISWCLDAVLSPRLLLLDAGNEVNVMIERNAKDGSSSITSVEGSRMTGFRSWSQGVFGDPLLSSCFQEPSAAFLEGWKESGEDIVEDSDNLDARVLIYRCFRAIVGIVTDYYRPQLDSSRRELDGRRKLTIVLAELEKVDQPGNDDLKRARSVSSMAEASKRKKLE